MTIAWPAPLYDRVLKEWRILQIQNTNTNGNNVILYRIKNNTILATSYFSIVSKHNPNMKMYSI